LDGTPSKNLGVTHGVFVFEFARDNVGEDLKFTVRVCAEPCTWCYAIFIDDTQGAILLVGKVLVRCKGERVESFEPAVVGVAAFFATTGNKFHGRHITGVCREQSKMVFDSV